VARNFYGQVVAIPLHAQVADRLRERIADGTLAVGQPVPSEAALVEEFGASRGTVRQALSTLRHEGLIDGGQGRQPVVRDAPIGQPFETLLSFSAWAQQSGRVPGQRTIEIARRGAGEAAAAALGLQVGDPVVDVLRLRFLDGAPVMLERSSFVPAVGRFLFDMDTDAGSIYAGLTEMGVDLYSARHEIDALAAPVDDAELLGVAAGSPLLRERRRACTRSGEPLEYADDRYRPDRATFTLTNTRSVPLPMVRDLRAPGDHDAG
jgi:GntR family transcriptional regulator